MSKQQFEIIEEDEPTIIPDVERQSLQEGASQERIQVPSANWIIRSRIEKTHKVFSLVEKQIKTNLDYRLKEYSFSHRNKLEVGEHVLVFNPT